MRTELIERKIDTSEGYGAGPGTIEEHRYKCPCGKGEIEETHDNIPGFREHEVYLCCPECSKKYYLDTSKGTRNWELKLISEKSEQTAR